MPKNKKKDKRHGIKGANVKTTDDFEEILAEVRAGDTKNSAIIDHDVSISKVSDAVAAQL